MAGSSVDHHHCLLVSSVVTALHPLARSLAAHSSPVYTAVCSTSLTPVSKCRAATFPAASSAAPGPQAQCTQPAVFSAFSGWTIGDAVNDHHKDPSCIFFLEPRHGDEPRRQDQGTCCQVRAPIVCSCVPSSRQKSLFSILFLVMNFQIT